MKVLRDNFSEKINTDTFVALGSFDGIHLGHQKLVEQTIEMTRKFNLSNKSKNAKSMVCTFYPHPLVTINSVIAPKLIMDNKNKIKVLENLGLDILNFMTFDKKLMQISPEEFITKLVKTYNVKGIVVGFNYKFGYKNLGDVNLLKKYSKLLNFSLCIVEPVKIEDEVISSSKIRKYIKEGNLEKANEMLGRTYSISGNVIKGKQIGSKIMGFPTINLKYDSKLILPSRGVYYTLVRYKGNVYHAMTNIGFNPTVNGKNLSVETNIFDFDKEIYGESVELYFVHKIREEKRFNIIEDLVNQLNKDKEFVKNISIKLNININ
ncbi:bifunctional riboflavin kinase/FAD synthetase [Clostridium sp. ATCC 25772]|uniref:bifunctional riboflavin kinase/FAD synthetase n=1 Tax=Clostridium sp. ATCC 25772 TaxID=1676991 RepID=UPI000783D332|nr:bifunctional riboflavin kinase/FAD synthetase [Clostridium sp. ATCC 25772]